MPRRTRATAGGLVYHVLNRGVGRMRLFRKAADVAAMEQVLEEAVQRTRARLLAYCLMCNHWHRVFCCNDGWAQRMAKRSRLESTFRSPGRPRTESAP